MMDFLKHIPGFRSMKKPKMIVASIYYLICLTAFTNKVGSFLVWVSLPFVFFSAVKVFKDRSKKSILSFLIPLVIMFIGISNMPDIQPKKSNLTSNVETKSTVPKKTNNITRTSQTWTTSTNKQAVSSSAKLEKATVTHHTDGDTIGVTFENGKYAKVRLIGVNTPESTTKHEQYGEQASNYTKYQLFGKTVYLESDVGDKDKYGRLLRYVWISKPDAIDESEIRSKMFNAILAYNGYAEQMTIQPNVKYAEYFKKFCAEARENNRGLWSINPNGTTKGDGISAPLNSSSNDISSSYGQGKIKGNINSKGEKIYHVPGEVYYDKTNAERYFNTESEARAAGYRPSRR